MRHGYSQEIWFSSPAIRQGVETAPEMPLLDLNNLKLEHGQVEFDGNEAYSMKLMLSSEPVSTAAAEGVCRQYHTNTAWIPETL